MSQVLSKAEWRNILRAKRKDISQDTRHRKRCAEQAIHHLVNTKIFHDSNHIACYYALPEEFDTTSLIHTVWQYHKRCYLPKLHLHERSLYFVPFIEGSSLQHNVFGINEPTVTAINDVIQPDKLDMILFPLVGFDHHGHRLGMGSGYYDRTCTALSHTTQKRPYFIGLGFSAQEVDDLPHDSWDIVLDGILTEQEFSFF